MYQVLSDIQVATQEHWKKFSQMRERQELRNIAWEIFMQERDESILTQELLITARLGIGKKVYGGLSPKLDTADSVIYPTGSAMVDM